MRSLTSKILIASVLVLLITGCKRKWKKTTEVTLIVRTDLTSNAPDYININEGTIYFGEVEFEGSRKQSSDVEFTEVNEYELDIINGNSNTSLIYDIPQGTYPEMKIELCSGPDYSGDNIYVKGYCTVGVDQEQFILEVEDLSELDITFKNNEDIHLVHGEKKYLYLNLNIGRWFNGISHTEFELAEKVYIDGEEVILFSNEYNTNLYHNILDKIESDFYIEE